MIVEKVLEQGWDASTTHYTRFRPHDTLHCCSILLVCVCVCVCVCACQMYYTTSTALIYSIDIYNIMVTLSA